jgi:ubiquinone/menaquinone biosynthesis C-methylase UbiE
MLSTVSSIIPLLPNIVERLQRIDDFYICTEFTEDMISSPVVSINGEVYFRFMNFIYLPQPPESLTAEQIKKICDVRLEYFDKLVNYQLNSSVVDSIANCVVAKHTTPLPCLKALDFGCGSGLSSQMLLERLPNLDLVGVDISEKAISCCREQYENIAAKLTSAGEPLPFETATFNVIFAVFVMHFKIDIQTLRELRRVLKPAGLFVFNVYQRDIDGLAAQLEEVGFCSIDVYDRLSNIGNNHFVMSCRLPAR